VTCFAFENKTVLVTGGSRGIGRAIALAFAQAGARVGIHYGHSQAAAEQTQAMLMGTGHAIFQADIADADAVEHMVNAAIATLGPIDILVNGAGIFQEKPLDATTYADWQIAWRQTIDTNLTGTANVAFCVAHHMIQRYRDQHLGEQGSGGRIINISSRGAFRGEPLALAYGASKAGLNSFSQSLAQHLAPYNIFVTAVAPGFVETDMARAILDSPKGEGIRQQSPLNRVARPEEVAHTVLFLASEGAEFLTGGIVDVNGASYLRS
jgi:NAD(P)-dependent dehydrogenase (short-subunit alcohol dehydrogenase family)